MAYRTDVIKSAANGFGIAGFLMVYYCIFSIGFWYGSRLVISGEITGGSVLVVFLGMILGIFCIVFTPASLMAIAIARVSAKTV